MQPMLDDLELTLVQEISTLERRVLAEHRLPGMAGSLFQNLGRRPFRLTLWGVAAGADAQGFVEALEGKFHDGRPLPFTADIAEEARLEQVVIRDLRVRELAGKPERFAYLLTLREFVEPTGAEEAAPLDEDIVADAAGLMEDMVTGLDTGLDLFDGLAQFVPVLTDFLARFREFGAAVAEAG